MTKPHLGSTLATPRHIPHKEVMMDTYLTTVATRPLSFYTTPPPSAWPLTWEAGAFLPLSCWRNGAPGRSSEPQPRTRRWWRTPRTVVALLVILAIVYGVSQVAAHPRDPSAPVALFPPGPTFGPVSLTHGQTLWLHVANVAEPDTPAVEVELSINDNAGNELAYARETLQTGHATFLALRGSDLLLDPGDRKQLIPCLRVLSRHHRTIVPTVEVWDNDSGKTSVLLAPIWR